MFHILQNFSAKFTKIARFSWKDFSKNCIFLGSKMAIIIEMPIFQTNKKSSEIIEFFVFQNINYLFETTFPFLITQSIT